MPHNGFDQDSFKYVWIPTYSSKFWIIHVFENFISSIKWVFTYFCIKFDNFYFYLKWKLGKLHFTTLDYTLNYILHPKLFECTFCTLNYYICYTLHPDFNFTVMLEHMTCTCVSLKRYKVKRPKTPLSNYLKTKTYFFIFYPSLSLSLSNQNLWNPKSPKQNYQWHHHHSTITPPLRHFHYLAPIN